SRLEPEESVMTFGAQLPERAARRRARLVRCEGDDTRVHAPGQQLRQNNVVEPIVLGWDGLNPAKDPRLSRIAKFLRERLPVRIRDGVPALDVAADTV